MKLFKLFIFVLALVANVPSAWADASGSCGANLNWTYVESTHTLTITGSGAMAGYNSDDVPWKDYESDITSIVLPDGLTHIGLRAFQECINLTSITIPNSVTSIGGNAFSNCASLSSITIPNSVTSIGNGAFSNCTSLTEITIPNGVTTIGQSVFRGCTGLQSVTLPNSLTSIDHTTFLGCTGLTSVTIPNGVTSLGMAVFSQCTALNSVTIPSSVTSIGAGTFRDCTSLTEITLPNSVGSIENNVFYGCTGLQSVTLPEALTTIGYAAFHQCSSLTSITIPSTVETIDQYAFDKCTALESITIPNSVITIGNYAFRYCTGLQSVTLPEALTAIAIGTFYNCSSLTSITIPSDVTSIGNWAFGNCSGLTEITIPSNVETIGENAFKGCTGLTDIYVPWTDLTGLTIDANMFGDLDLSGITLHVPAGSYATYAAVEPWNSVKILDPNYFGQCGDNLTWEFNPSTGTLTISGTGDMEEYYATNQPWKDYKAAIQTVVIENGATSIGDNAFNGCTGLTEVHFADNSQLTNIKKFAFGWCTNLTSINIPNSVTSIGENAFYDCSSLTSVTIPEGVSIIGSYTFVGCTSLTSVTIPSSVTRIYYQAFKGCTGLTEVHFADNSQLTNIEHQAFHGCTSLASITIPASVTSIEQRVFNGCTGLTSITIPAGVTSIGNYVFQNCTGLHDVYVNWGTNPPFLDTYVFYGVDIAAVNLHLPFAAWSNYETANIWKNFKHVPVVTAKGDPEHAGVYYSTFYHGSTKYALPAGVEAYTAQLNGAELNLTKIAEEGDVLPAATAVILKSSVEDYELVPSDASPVTAGENDLLGKDAATSAPANCYVLSGQSSDHSVSGVGFYQFSGTLGAHKAYLTIPSGSPAPKRISFAYGTTTDIEATADAATQGAKKMLRNGQLVILLDGVEYNAQGQFIR